MRQGQLTKQEIAEFARPWSTMPREALQVIGGTYVVRRT
jgi:hypothetical protein